MLLQLVCLLTFWLLLRQTLTEKRDKQKDRQLSAITVLIKGKTVCLTSHLSVSQVNCLSDESPVCLIVFCVLQRSRGSRRSCRRRRRRRCLMRRCCSWEEEFKWRRWLLWLPGCLSNTGSTSVEQCSSSSVLREKSSSTKLFTW